MKKEFELAFFEEGAMPNLQLADPNLVTYYVLEKERKVFIDFEIDESLLSVVRLILRWNAEDKGKSVEERVPIKLYIISPGGDVDCMWSCIDTIMASVTPVWTINMGACYSAAAEIFLAGSVRFMLPHSRMMIHEGSTMMGGNANTVLNQADAYRTLLEQSRNFILERTNIPEKDMKKHQKDDWVMDTKYCLDHGVCHHVIQSLDEIV